MNRFVIGCRGCGRHTSRAFARVHDGYCKSCSHQLSNGDVCERCHRKPSLPRVSAQARIIDSGWEAYAREEGHYDGPDY